METYYKTLMLKIAEADTKDEFNSINREIREAYTSNKLYWSYYKKLSSQSSRLFNAIYKESHY